MTALFEQACWTFDIDGVSVDVSAIHRSGTRAPIVFLHGFGSTKEDYADIVLQPGLKEHPFLAIDAPGCGKTQMSDLSKTSIPFLVKTALAAIETVGVARFHLVGHSMGGLASLMLADAHPDRVLSFVDIEGNIAPEDCFLSRQIIEYPADDPYQFLQAFIERTRQSGAFASALYASTLPDKVRPAAVRGIFQSMVDLSDNAGLMDRFLGLPCPKMFLYGDQNRHLSYLNHIADHGVHLAEIPDCGHFPMYSNPPAMWRAITRLIQSVPDRRRS